MEKKEEKSVIGGSEREKGIRLDVGEKYLMEADETAPVPLPRTSISADSRSVKVLQEWFSKFLVK